MNALSSYSTRNSHALPARVLLCSRDLRQYQRWQSLYTSPATYDQKLMTAAYEYDVFRTWLSKQDSGYFSDVFDDISEHISPSSSFVQDTSGTTVAPICGHRLHPVAAARAQQWPQCPVCIVELHTEYLDAVSKALRKAAGRALPGTGTPSEQQEILYRAWSSGKLEVLTLVEELEDIAVEESAWEETHETPVHEEVKTAREALQKYWMETSGFNPATRLPEPERKRLRFAEDTDYTPGRCSDYFWQKSLRYTPGKYTLHDKDTLEDPEEHHTLVLTNSQSSVEDEPQSEELEDLSICADTDTDDTEWTDVDSDCEDDDVYICFEVQETEYIVFSED